MPLRRWPLLASSCSSSRSRSLALAATLALVGGALPARTAFAQGAPPAEPLPAAQPATPPAPAAPPPAEPLPPATDPLAQPPSPSPSSAPPASPPPPPPDASPRYAGPPEEPPIDDGPRPMSEGRAIVSAWNTGFQWGIAPGIVFYSGKTGFFLGVRLGYGFDTGSVILVPGVRLGAYFTDPNIYVGMPVMKLVFPIDRFAPFVEAGGGLGHIAAGGSGLTSSPSATGAALLAGGGFMIHFTPRFALGAEANYQTITGTGFKGFGVGPIIAIAF